MRERDAVMEEVRGEESRRAKAKDEEGARPIQRARARMRRAGLAGCLSLREARVCQKKWGSREAE